MSGTEYRYSDLDASQDTHGLLRYFFLRGVGAFFNWFLHAYPVFSLFSRAVYRWCHLFHVCAAESNDRGGALLPDI